MAFEMEIEVITRDGEAEPFRRERPIDLEEIAASDHLRLLNTNKNEVRRKRTHASDTMHAPIIMGMHDTMRPLFVLRMFRLC